MARSRALVSRSTPSLIGSSACPTCPDRKKRSTSVVWRKETTVSIAMARPSSPRKTHALSCGQKTVDEILEKVHRGRMTLTEST